MTTTATSKTKLNRKTIPALNPQISIYCKKKVIKKNELAMIPCCMLRGDAVLQVDVVELHLQLTPLMTNCQTALLDLINVCIKELKRCTPAVS